MGRAAGHAVRAVRDVKSALLRSTRSRRPGDRRPRAGRARRPGRLPRLRADHRADDAGCWRYDRGAQGHRRRRARRGRRRLFAPPVVAPRAAVERRAACAPAQQRADDAIVRALMITSRARSTGRAWHADFTLELIERRDRADLGLSGGELHRQQVAHALGIVHPDDRPKIEAGRTTRATRYDVRVRVPDRPAPTARSAGCSIAGSSCPAPAAACGATARSST